MQVPTNTTSWVAPGHATAWAQSPDAASHPHR
jgi:hypothetical protein